MFALAKVIRGLSRPLNAGSCLQRSFYVGILRSNRASTLFALSLSSVTPSLCLAFVISLGFPRHVIFGNEVGSLIHSATETTDRFETDLFTS